MPSFELQDVEMAACTHQVYTHPEAKTQEEETHIRKSEAGDVNSLDVPELPLFSPM